MLDQVQKPTRYTGGEMNTQLKPWDSAKLHFAFCFPDTYEVGMSHLGMKILYAAMNQQPDMLCERAFMPWVDMMELMKQENVPLFTLESRSPLSAFDVVGFTLQYEMSYSNILAMLELGGIPLLRENRREEDPIVVAGGPCAFNPEPLADFIDAFMVGDGEEQILDLNRVIMQGREEGASRMTILKRLCAIRGVYVPALYDVQYNADGTIASMKPNCPEAPEKVLKAIIPDLDKAFYPTEIPVPYMEIIHDRIMLEIMRGCTRGCRFCQAGMLYRPVRERRVETLTKLAEKLTKSTGYDEISLTDDFKLFSNDGEEIVSPEALGFERCHDGDLYGGETVAEAAAIFDRVLDNTASEAQKNAVIANAAYAIRTFDTKRPIETCVALARETVESGRARATFRKFIELNS